MSPLMSASRHRFLPALVLALCLSACASRAPTMELFDFGPLPATTQKTSQNTAQNTAPQNLPALALSEIEAPPWLDGQTMFYRLLQSSQQPRAYGSSRWSMSPAQLLEQRLRARYSQAGGVIIQADGTANLPFMQVEIDDFVQNFATPGSSEARVALRVSLFNGRMLMAQKSFARSLPAPGANAAGGASALAAASDAVIDDLLLWIPSVALKK